MNLFLFLLSFFLLSGNQIYNRINLQDIRVELGHDINNKCLNNITIQNKTDKKIVYSVQIWRGKIWYFKHNLELEPGEIKFYDNAFITCDNHSEISVDLTKGY